MCPRGFYCDDKELAKSCPDGTYSEDGEMSPSCKKCPKGKKCPDPTQLPIDCDFGQFSPEVNFTLFLGIKVKS